jgi:hypothetical protein
MKSSVEGYWRFLELFLDIGLILESMASLALSPGLPLLWEKIRELVKLIM